MNAVGSLGAGRLAGPGWREKSRVDGDPGEQGTKKAWRDAAGLWLPLAARAPCTELLLRAVKGSDFRKRCKRSF